MSKVTISNIDIDSVTMAQTLARIQDLVAEGTPAIVVTPNVDHIVRLRRDREFLDVYKRAKLVLADGVPLLWAARFLRTPLPQKVSGSDLFPEVCRVSAQNGYKLFFLGGRPGAASRAAEAMLQRYPGIVAIDSYCPPFGFERDEAENRRVAIMIKQASPDILFVGLGAPKQEKWIFGCYQDLGVPVSIGVGATFDFISGFVRRSPELLQQRGLEWLWRLLMEPKRLWRRYLVEDMRFAWIIFQQKLSRHKANQDT